MKCPIDNTTLTITERSGIEIDFCGECRGVWLDRGELDKILERASEPQRGYDQPRYETRERYQEKDYRPDGGHYPKKKKRESFLGELFDF